MYLPKHFSVSRESALKLMESYPFASVISVGKSGTPEVNHLPLLVEREADSVKLIGHMARRNPQWRELKDNPTALAVFLGPHAYITPKWYVSGRDVPTWNYAVVHVSGPVKLLESFAELNEILAKLSRRFEEGRSDPWELELPDDLRDPEALTNSIVGFEIEARVIEGKFKLSQNRSREDRDAVMQGLATQEGEMSHLVRQMMRDSGAGE